MPPHPHLSSASLRPARSRAGLALIGLLALVTAGLSLVGGPAQAGPEAARSSAVPAAERAPSEYGVLPQRPRSKIVSRRTAPREIGMRLSPKVAGVATGVRVYKATGRRSATPRTGALWSARGTLLAKARFTKTKGAGWRAVRFSSPVQLKAGKTYVVSAYAARGRFASTPGGFEKAKSTRYLTAPAGKNGVYRSTSGSGFPNRGSKSSANFWVDVTFQPGGATTTADPTDPPTDPTDPPTEPSGPCVGPANKPGGPDPWGGCWPGPHNTGYPQGLPGDVRTPVSLTPYTGPMTIRSCGVVIDSKVVEGDLLIEAGNGTTSESTPCVTIKNSLVRGVVFSEKKTYGPTVIQDTEVVPSDLPWWENIGRSNLFVYRVNSHGGEGVIKCEVNCVARDNWVHGMNLGGEYHYNAFGGNGTNAFTIDHNYASCGDWEKRSNPAADAGCSAVIGFYGDFAPIQNISITRNFLASTFSMSGDEPSRQAGYCINPGYYPGKPYPAPSNMTITDNVFARGVTGKCGVYGPSNSLNARGATNGNVWERNRYEDGVAIARVTE
jgi:hypothetical protein